MRSLAFARVPFTRRLPTEISPATFRLIATNRLSALSLIRTLPAMSGIADVVVSIPSTSMLANALSLFSKSNDFPLKVLTSAAVIAPLPVCMIAPLAAFSVSFFPSAFTLPSNSRLSLAARVTSPPAAMAPVTASFLTFPLASFSTSRPTDSEPSLTALNSPWV